MITIIGVMKLCLDTYMFLYICIQIWAHFLKNRQCHPNLLIVGDVFIFKYFYFILFYSWGGGCKSNLLKWVSLPMNPYRMFFIQTSTPNLHWKLEASRGNFCMQNNKLLTRTPVAWDPYTSHVESGIHHGKDEPRKVPFHILYQLYILGYLQIHVE